MPGITLSELLKKMIEMGGSDLHITTNSAPRVRVHGRLRPLDMPPLTAADTKSLAYSVLTDAQKHRFEENLELDFSFGLKNLARFRGNVFNQRGAVGSVFRTIPWEIKGFDALGLPLVVKGLCDKPRGLVLVTGPTGSGKRSEEHTSELQSHSDLVCRLLLEKKKAGKGQEQLRLASEEGRVVAVDDRRAVR